MSGDRWDATRAGTEATSPQRQRIDPATRTAVAAGVRPERWTDCHCHLPTLGAELERTLASSMRAGVMRLVNVGHDVGSSTAAATVAASEVGIWSTAGIHPGHASSPVAAAVDDLTAIEMTLFQPKVVAVGECGLDYRAAMAPTAQRSLFAAQIALAHAYDRALVVHSVNTWADTFAVLRAEGVPARTVLSPFTGPADAAREALDLGMTISFNAALLLEDRAELRHVAAACPLEQIVVEASELAAPTSTTMPPGPAFVPTVGRTVAELAGRSPTEMALITWSNSRELYRLR